MVDALTRYRWLFVHLLSVSLTLGLWVQPAGAFFLKDIRIGEYDTFTRIVFESNGATTPETITSAGKNQLKLVFAATRPDLIRKIPFDRSRFIDNLQINSLENQLIITLDFSVRYTRFDAFDLKSPRRTVLDLFWQPLASQPLRETDPIAGTEAIPLGTGLAPEQAKTTFNAATVPPGSVSAPQTSIDQPSDAGRTASPPSPVVQEAVHIRNASPTSRPEKQAAEISDTGTHLDQQAEPRDTEGAARTNRFQYYLVVALVIITIVILLLIGMTMVWKHRSGIETDRLKTNDYLQYQDKQIASLNARIEEQLQRYHQA